MTAPDVNADVRARFEAWAVQKGLPVEKEMARKGVLYESFVTGFAWLAWKQVHADLAGEVRELVERWERNASHAGFKKPVQATYLAAANELQTALAKFTREKP